MLAVLLSFSAFAQKQEVTVEFGETELLLTEKFYIKVKIRAEGDKIGDFPTIEGFSKGGRSVAHTNYKMGNKRGIQHTILQNYIPQTVGNFKVSPFTLLINGENVSVDGVVVKVLSDKKTSIETSIENITTIDAKEDAFIAVSVEKDNVYVGEGSKVSLSFYVSELNTVGWGFPDDFTAQVDAIARKIKPENCLESRLLISNVQEEKVILNKKKYKKYKVFEAVYYPLNEKSVKIPTVELSMWKKNEEDKRTGQRTFKTRPNEIKVKRLPEHPLKDKVAVGNFTLKEWLTTTQIETGKSFTYKFWILGEGNFATINFETPSNDNSFDFFPAKLSNSLKMGEKIGEKLFEYRVFPKIANQYQWKEYIQWIYFNTEKETYDTLQSKLSLKITGEKINSAKSNLNDIFDNLENIDTSEEEIDYAIFIKNIANVLVIGMIIVLLAIYQRNKKIK